MEPGEHQRQALLLGQGVHGRPDARRRLLALEPAGRAGAGSVARRRPDASPSAAAPNTAVKVATLRFFFERSRRISLRQAFTVIE